MLFKTRWALDLILPSTPWHRHLKERLLFPERWTWLPTKKREHERDIRLTRNQTSAVSEHANKTGHRSLWNGVKFSERDSHWYTRRVKEATHIRLKPDTINRHHGIEIPEAWIPTIKKHKERLVLQQTAEGTTWSMTFRKTSTNRNNGDRNPPIAFNRRNTNSNARAVDPIA